jgi:hypothetical protein
MGRQSIVCGPVQNQGWGLLTELRLPGGGKLGVYQPRHARPKPMDAGKRASPVAGRSAKKTVRKAAKRKKAGGR